MKGLLSRVTTVWRAAQSRMSRRRSFDVDGPASLEPPSVAVPVAAAEDENAAAHVVEERRWKTRIPLTPIHAHELSELAAIQGVAFRKMSLTPRAVVHVPELKRGRHQLAHADIAESTPHIQWRDTSYLSFPVSVYAMENVLVHGAVGITAVGEYAILETTFHTLPQRHRYEATGPGLVLLEDEIGVLPGTYISLLVGGAESYWHSVVDCAARLAALPDELLAQADGILLPSTGIGLREMVDLYGVPDRLAVEVLSPDDTFRVEKLVMPSSLHGLLDYDATLLNAFFDRVLGRAPVPTAGSPTHIYIDRRGSSLRPLRNESELIDALEQIGFTALRLETLSVSQQISVFRGAKIIVAPHGAGLTNIGYAGKGTIVIELMMNYHLHWCFRRMAALRSLQYDCFIGTSLSAKQIALENIQAQAWVVDVDRLVGFVEQAMAA